MNDYINREDVVELFRDDIVEITHQLIAIIPTAERDFEVHNECCKRHIKMISNLPSADVVERKRGAWIKGETWSEGYGIGEQYGRYYTCSKCSHTVQDNYRECSMNFCPNCGADMRKQTERHIDE